MDEPNNPELRALLRFCRLERTFTQGEGVWLTDEEGRRFLDAGSQFGAVALGHNADVVTAAVRAALDRHTPAMVQPHVATNAEALGRALFAATGLPRCVFTTSGAETVETAIKLVRAGTGRSMVLAASQGYHGKTLAALSLTGRAQHADGFGPLAPGFDRVPFGDADALAARIAREPDGIAALVLEPILGEGGVILPPPGYLRRARQLCDQHGIALVLDEIQTGLGRTGQLFACQEEGVTPDVLLIAKALGGGLFPLGACLASERFWDARFALGHSSTFANNNVACAVGLAVLRALTGGSLLADVRARGQRLEAGLRRLRARYPHVVADVRGRGLLWAVELARPASDRDGLVMGYLQHQGLYAYAAAALLAEQSSVLVMPTLGAGNVLRVAPPLVIDDDGIDRVLGGLETLCAHLGRNRAESIVRGLGWLRPEAAAPAALVVPPPAPRARAKGRRRWAFLVHYTSVEDLGITEPGLARLGTAERAALAERLAALPAGACHEAPVVRSVTGAEADGHIIALPLLPEAMLRRGRRAMRPAIAAAVDLAARLGADVVGLGGYTTPLCDRGRAVVGRGVVVTTGNALTAAAAFASTEAALAQDGLRVSDLCIGVAGARGSVGALLARLAARARPQRLLLVGSPHGDLASLSTLAAEIAATGVRVEVSRDVRALAGCEVVLSATAAAKPLLDDVPFPAGALICDVARPGDTGAQLRMRRDLTVIEGGVMALPDPALQLAPGNLQGLPPGFALACLSETIVHALEGTQADHGVGDDIPLATADRVLALAQRHGFRVALPQRPHLTHAEGARS